MRARIVAFPPQQIKRFMSTEALSLGTTPVLAPALKPLTSIPGPLSLPFLGTKLDFLYRIKRSKGFWQALSTYYQDYGVILKHKVARGHEIFVFTPELGLEAFRQEGSYPISAGTEFWVMGLYQKEAKRGPLALAESGPEWFKMRKILQKDIFPRAAAETYLPLLDETCRVISQQFPKVARSDQISCQASMDMICSVLIGYNPKTVLGPGQALKEDLEFMENVGRLTELGVKIVYDPRRSPEKPGPLWPEFFGIANRAYARADYYFEKYVVAQKAQYQDLPDDTEQPIPYVFRLMKRGEITVEEAQDEILSILLAGVDTTHHVLLWLLFHLGRHPDKQEILRKQLLSVLGDGPLEAKHVKSLPYLHHVIREAHRLTPISPVLATRRFPEDGMVGGYHIPKGTKVTVCTHDFQNDPRYVDQPDKFLPERWAPEEVASRKGTTREVIDHKLLAKPFGYGQRMCLGSRLAEVELKAVLSRIVRDWRFEWSPKEQSYETVIATGLKASPYPTFSWTSAK